MDTIKRARLGSGSPHKVESNGYFPPHQQQFTGRVLPIHVYGSSTCVPDHINATGK
jgi:hypothetical protein